MFSSATDVQRQNGPTRAFRIKRFAGVLVLHWFAQALWLRLVDQARRLGQRRAGAGVIVMLCGAALGAVLALPDEPAASSITTERVASVAAIVPASPSVPLRTADATLRTASEQAPAPDILATRTTESWLPVKRPIALYNLEGPETEATDFSLRVAMLGQYARQDAMHWSARADRIGPMTRPAIHMVVERFELRPQTFRPFFADIASRAAMQGVAIDRMNPVSEIMTKFGVIEAADAMLATEQGQLGCLLFRRIDTIGFALAGWYCGSAQRPADRVSLACFIDRLDLVGAGQDHVLKKYFAAAERHRKSCSAARQPGRRLTWLDHEAPMPALKLSARMH